MPIEIGLVVHWPDGSTGTILQEAFRRDDRHAFVATLTAKREGHPDIHGHLRVTGDVLERLPGDDVRKSNAIAIRLADWVAKRLLEDNFFLHVEIDDSGVQLFSTAHGNR